MPVTLKSLKPKETDFEPRTFGEHVRWRGLVLNLTQQEVAAQLGVVSWTILNWEKGHTEPPIASIPGWEREEIILYRQHRIRVAQLQQAYLDRDNLPVRREMRLARFR